MTWRYTFILAAGIVFIVTGLWATAAPIGPRSEKLSDEILSLGGLKQIQLEVEQIPAPLNEAGLEQQTVDNLIQQSLKEGGFVIMKDEDVPRLLVRVQAVTNSDDPGGLGALVIVAVHQKVTVERLGTQLKVPTMTASYAGYTAKQDIAKLVEKKLPALLAHFVRLVHKARADSREATSQR